MNADHAKLKPLAEKLQSLQQEGRFDEALQAALELNRLAPDDGDVRTAAGFLSLGLGQFDQALAIFEDGIRRAPQDLYFRMNFLKALYLSGFNRYDEKVQHWIGVFLQDPQSVNIALISRLWLTVLINDPAYAGLLEGGRKGDYETFAAWFPANVSAFGTALTADYFLNGIRNCVIPDVAVERLLVYLRRWLLEAVVYKAAAPPAWTLPLAIAIAEQCFVNEYVYAETAVEKSTIENLALQTGKSKNPDPLAVAVLAAYRPLFTLPAVVQSMQARKAFTPADLAQLQRLFQRQIDEPEREQKIKKKIRHFGRISNTVSQKVQTQYEEHPYPRWISYGRVPDEQDNLVVDNADRIRALDILVAGCATGHFPIRVAMNYPYSWVTGIDLSLASLAYGVRKAEEMGIDNIDLLHGDILDAGKLGKTFDIIFSIGVLHHMGDPEQGWRALVDVLKPGGLMKIGLYPEYERKHIAWGRAYIAEHGLPDTVDGIRQMRQVVIDLPAGHPLKKIMPFNDFYSTSMMRDLLFHVQEQSFTLPRVKKDLADFGLEFLGFPMLSPDERATYATMFPDDPAMLNLDNWDVFEQKYPDTFTGLYQFWCRKRT